MLICFACVVLAVVLCRPRSNPHGPSYAGRSLERWIDEYGNSYQTDGARLFEDAVRHMGTNQIPYLLEWIQYDPPPWKTRLYEIINHSLQWVIKDFELEDRNAVRSKLVWRPLGILGPEAKQAIPELMRMLTNSTSLALVARAANALPAFGEEAVPALMAAMTNQQAQIRATAIHVMSYLETNAQHAIPTLVALLNDPDVLIRKEATNALLKIAPEALTNASPK